MTSRRGLLPLISYSRTVSCRPITAAWHGSQCVDDVTRSSSPKLFARRATYPSYPGTTTERKRERENARAHSPRLAFCAMHVPKRLDHYRCLRHGRLARVNGRFLFRRRKGLREKILKNEASVRARPGCAEGGAAAFRVRTPGETPRGFVVVVPNRRVVPVEIKSVRFPRVSGSPGFLCRCGAIKFDTVRARAPARLSAFPSISVTRLALPNSYRARYKK